MSPFPPTPDDRNGLVLDVASGRRRHLQGLVLGAAALAGSPLAALAQTAANLPVRPEWRNTAQRVAQAGVPVEDLAPNAPDSYTVQGGDTLWRISGLFLKSAWRWPELWGMNLAEIRNPHLIYPGQVLVLDRVNGRASLRLARAGEGPATNTVKLSPQIRSQLLDNGAIASIPLNLIGPFLNEAVVFDSNELDAAPRIVATQEGHVLLSRGELAYVRGDRGGAREFRLFRELQPLKDPLSGEVLGYEGRYVGTAEYQRSGSMLVNTSGKGVVVPDTYRIVTTRLEAKVGDRLSPVPQQELVAYAPHPPTAPIEGRIVSIYGDGLRAGQNQVVALNRGSRDGLERGNVLALWHAGREAVDTTGEQKVAMRLPDERQGLLFVFRAFERVSYALILTVQQPVVAGDRFTQP